MVALVGVGLNLTFSELRMFACISCHLFDLDRCLGQLFDFEALLPTIVVLRYQLFDWVPTSYIYICVLYEFVYVKLILRPPPVPPPPSPTSPSTVHLAHCNRLQLLTDVCAILRYFTFSALPLIFLKRCQISASPQITTNFSMQ